MAALAENIGMEQWEFFCLLHDGFSLVLLFDPEDGGYMFLRKIH
jgi:hypothetical protein